MNYIFNLIYYIYIYMSFYKEPPNEYGTNGKNYPNTRVLLPPPPKNDKLRRLIRDPKKSKKFLKKPNNKNKNKNEFLRSIHFYLNQLNPKMKNINPDFTGRRSDKRKNFLPTEKEGKRRKRNPTRKRNRNNNNNNSKKNNNKSKNNNNKSKRQKTNHNYGLSPLMEKLKINNNINNGYNSENNGDKSEK
jgi:hypothetical protein